METFQDKKSAPKPSSAELTRRQKIARRLLPAVALSLAAGGYAGNEVKEKAEYHEVGSVTYEIGDNQTPIDAVRESVNQMSFVEDGKKLEITGVTREGQEVARELTEQTGEEYVQPGDAIEVTVSKNGFGNYKLEADPADTDGNAVQIEEDTPSIEIEDKTIH